MIGRPVTERALPDLSGQRLHRVAVFGGIYSNHLALEAAVADAAARGVDAMLCLGDLGAFGPNPDKVFPILEGRGIPVVRGNYDDSIARGLDDCQCGYTDPSDNYFARLSYQYTFEHTSAEHRALMSGFPSEVRFTLGDRRVLAFHGSPRQMNEFLWESTTPTHFLEMLAREHGADLLLGTHTGLHWERALAGGGHYVNVGALGRPANDGRTDVWYAVLDTRPGYPAVEFVPVAYDHESLAREIESEGLPGEFAQTIRSGWWTTCLEILPGKERARGKY